MGGLTQAQLDAFTSSLQPPPEELAVALKGRSQTPSLSSNFHMGSHQRSQWSSPATSACWGNAPAAGSSALWHDVPQAGPLAADGMQSIAAAGEVDDEPSSPQAAQLRRARRMQQSAGSAEGPPDYARGCYGEEEPSSPQAAQIRRAKRIAQGHSGSRSSTCSPPQELHEGIIQDELDAISLEPPAGDLRQLGEPTSPQARLLLRHKRLAAHPHPAVHPAAAQPVAAQQNAAHAHAGISQGQLDSLSKYCPLSPQGSPGLAQVDPRHLQGRHGETPPFFPNVDEAAWPPAQTSLDGESSPLARKLRWAKHMRHAGGSGPL